MGRYRFLYFLRGRWRGPIRIPGRLVERRFRHVVTEEGGGTAGALLNSRYIQVGTGWTGHRAEINTRCNFPAGGMQVLDSGYPVAETARGPGGGEDTTVVCRATFPAGRLRDVCINEACLFDGNDLSAGCLAYARLSPAADIRPEDTLRILWAITIHGE